MLFTSITFIYIFLPITILIYYLLPKREIRNTVLFLLSLFFYAWGEPTFVLVMIGSIIMNWCFGLLVAKSAEKKALVRFVVIISVVANLSIIFIFKYLNFTVENLNLLFHGKIVVPEIALPIGISFFTFQAVSYVIDVYRGNGKAQKNLINVGLYISFFPQLIAGPIVRYETVAEQIKNRKETFSMFCDGVLYFVRGFCKKILLANNMAVVADRAFGTDLAELSVAFAWIGAVAYTFQIFFDFSGYSDMAIGLGKMFGFEFLPNFNYPYISTSISEFWRRWHISLGTWFRDYVYFPLGGSRVKSRVRLVFNLFVVWILTGIWHGANWTFVCWGLMYFVLITMEKLTGLDKREAASWGSAVNLCRYCYTILFVILGWVLFRADNIGQAFHYMKTMFGMGGCGGYDYLAKFYFMEYGVFFMACIVCSVPVAGKIKQKFSKVENVKYLLYGMLFLISLTYIIKGSYNPFIYFNF